jgi:tRNA(adenine34) deaminase
MRTALELALRAEQAGEVPIGALVVQGRDIIGSGWNQPIALQDPSAHAEIIALRAAAAVNGNYRLESATLYVTLEPCAMCTGALLNARVARVVFGAWDAKAGACGSLFDLPREPKLTHRMDVFGGVLRDECSEQLQRFFRARRGT